VNDMFFQGVKYTEGSVLYRTGEPKIFLHEILEQRPWCWDSFIVELIEEYKGRVLFKCSDDNNIDNTKWVKIENEFEIKIDKLPLQAYGPG